MWTLSPKLPPAGLLRRLGAVFYDTLLLGGLLFAAAALALLVSVWIVGGEAVQTDNPLLGNPLFSGYLLLVCFFFFGWFWTHGGQTLGMRAWKIRVQQRSGESITWQQALLRFLLAIVSWLVLGLGFLWILMDRDQMTWHDRFSRTVLVRLPS